jgi:hypothetical protein
MEIVLSRCGSFFAGVVWAQEATMPSQPISPSTAPAAPAPFAQLSQLLWKPPLLTGVDRLHLQLACSERRGYEATLLRTPALSQAHSAYPRLARCHSLHGEWERTDRVRSSLSSAPSGLAHQAAHSTGWVGPTEARGATPQTI